MDENNSRINGRLTVGNGRQYGYGSRFKEKVNIGNAAMNMNYSHSKSREKMPKDHSSEHILLEKKVSVPGFPSIQVAPHPSTNTPPHQNSPLLHPQHQLQHQPSSMDFIVENSPRMLKNQSERPHANPDTTKNIPIKVI